MSSDSPSGVADLVAREAIRTNLFRYARGVDRRDWDMVRATYHPDAHDDHGNYKGDVDGLIDWLSRRHALVRNCVHFIGNILIEFTSPEVALVESYANSYQRYGPEAGESRTIWLGDSAPAGDVVVDVTFGGRYIDVVECRAGDWRVAKRAVTFEWISAAPAPEAELDSTFLISRRDRTDALYTQAEAARQLSSELRVRTS